MPFSRISGAVGVHLEGKQAPGAAQPCVDESGLYYETYIYEDSGGEIDEAVIACRGTENQWSQYFL